MAILPDDTALGGLPSANSGRQVATYDATGVARGMAAQAESIAKVGALYAQGAQQFGKGVQSAANDVSLVQQQQYKDATALDVAKADAYHLVNTKQLQDQLSDETDPNKLQERYTPQFQKITTDAASLIQDPKQRELWQLKQAPVTETSILAAGTKEQSIQRDQSLAWTYDQLEKTRQAGLTEKDPAKIHVYIDAANNLIDKLANAGPGSGITAVQAQQLRSKFTNDFAVAKAEALPPAERIAFLQPAPMDKTAIVNRIIGNESTSDTNATNPNSSAAGLGQFTNQTWLETLKNHGPANLSDKIVFDPSRPAGQRYATTDPSILDLKKDPTLSRAMVGYLVDDNSAVLRNLGVVPTPANIYLAHVLGAGTAAKVITASPGTPINTLVDKAAIDANQSVLAGKTADSVVTWAAQKMGGTPRGQNGLVDFIREDQRNIMVQQATKQVAAQLYDQQRATETGDSHDVKTYGPGFYAAYQQVHAPAGDPSRITDASVFYSRVGPNGDLTTAGVDKLASEIAAKKTPEGESGAALRKAFFDYAYTQISGADPMTKMKDPKGDELYLKWSAKAWGDYEDGKKKGKTDIQLLNPDSPDYIGKSIHQMKRPMNVWMADVLKDNPGLAGNPPAAQGVPANFDIQKVQSLPELMSAYNAHLVSRAVAMQVATEKGWIATPPAAPALQVSQ